MIILDGKAVSQKILTDLKNQIARSRQKPRLDIVLVGDDPASLQYTQMKQKRASEVGIEVQVHQFPSNSPEEKIIFLINHLNQDIAVTGIMVQLPLPPPVNTQLVLNSIDPHKDADGLTSTSLGQLFQRHPNVLAPATAAGVMSLLENFKVDLVGKNVVIIGRSVEVGLPLLALMIAANATVTVCHSHTQNLTTLCSQADILISAVGQPSFISSDFVKKNAVVVDVGLSPHPQTGKLVGDVDFESVKQKVSYLTPVPGGVGPMTIAALLTNTWKIFQQNQS